MAENKKICVVDDEPDIVTYTTTLLEDNGFDTVSAADGEQAWQVVRAEKPDLILLDITMPEKSGVRFYRELRDDEAFATTPVIIVTGVSKDFERFISSRRQVRPPEGYLSKPIDPAGLIDTVRRVLEAANE